MAGKGMGRRRQARMPSDTYENLRVMSLLLIEIRETGATAGRRHYTSRRLNRESELVKRFFSISLGILCLVATYSSGRRGSGKNRMATSQGRCQAMTVRSWTTTRASRQPVQTRESPAQRIARRPVFGGHAG
jgi:hypothetical protein